MSSTGVKEDSRPAGPQDSLMNRLPLQIKDEQQKTALQFAIYNTLLFSLLGVCLVSIFAVYQMLYMFLMPILWASLVGTVLFPLKRMISDRLRGWLVQLDELDRPLLVGIALLPVQMTMRISNFIYDTILSFTGVCIGIGYIVLKILCYYDGFTTLLNWLSRLHTNLDALIGIFTLRGTFYVLALYAGGFGAWIYLQDLPSINKKLARVASLPIWLSLLAYISDFFGPVRVFVFALCSALLILISAGLIEPNLDNGEDLVEHPTAEEQQQQTPSTTAPAEEGLNKSASVQELTAASDSRLDLAISSDVHLRIIGGLCALLWAVNHDSLLIPVFVLFGLAFLFRMGTRLAINEYLVSMALTIKDQIVTKSNKFVTVIVAGPLRKFVHLLFTSDRMFISGLSARVDLISSVCVMALLAIGSLFAFLFTLFQLHSETLHLVKLGGNVLSSNPDWLRYALNYTEGQLAQHDIDNYMEQAYQQSRAWLASNIRSLADPKDPARADQLEDQAKLLVDNLYHLWEERSKRMFEEPVPEDAVVLDRDSMDIEDDSKRRWLSQLVKNANFGLWKEQFTTMMSENIEMVWTITRSIWHVLLTNLSLLGTVLIALLSLLLAFGFELLNFLIECIVFLTTVYYLLASSSDQWLPLHWVSSFSDSFQLQQFTGHGGDGRTLNVAKAVERAINGVFVLSTKMAIFYGLYTYFVHSLFTLNVVFIPAILAAVLAAIPIVPPYAVALFGFVELYLVRGEAIAALVFAAAAIGPLFFADPAFYREVRGSHPYLTGLAVMGGLYWLGLQGAIIGPIILCLMIALVNLYAEFANCRKQVPVSGQ